MRQTIGEEFHKIYKQAERFAEKLHVEPIIPRSAVRQMHRKNAPVKNPEEYYRRALVSRPIYRRNDLQIQLIQ